MHKRFVIAAFLIVIAVLTLLVLQRKYNKAPEQEETEARVVTPLIDNSRISSSQDFSVYESDDSIASLIPLNGNETLVAVVCADFDGDGYEDQVNAIKTITGPYISLLVGLYNPELQQYERSAVIATKISQVRTFSFDSIDLTGEHKASLVYQGFTDNGISVLQAFFISKQNGKAVLKQIVNLEGDDSVFIQQVERFDAYERSQASGASYPIWVYTSDAERPSSNDQLQIMYNWSVDEQKYVEVKRTRITGSNIAAKELAKIQDGTVESFASFLDGLWYLTSSKSDNRYYLYFNYEESEIIFMNSDREEVYYWDNSNLRRNGIYLSATNKEISNLKRRVDVTLKSVDKVTVRLQDDLKMLITESTSWDGEYKKMTSQTLLNSVEEEEDPCLPFLELLESWPSWKVSDGSVFSFANGSYTNVGSDGLVDKGLYTKVVFAGEPFIQLRSSGASPWTSGMYHISYSWDEESGKSNQESVVLQSYKLTPEMASPKEDHILILVKNSIE